MWPPSSSPPVRRLGVRAVGLLMVLALLLPISTAASARSRADAPTLDITLPWEGAVRFPGWTEVQVTLTAAETPWSGELRLEDRGQKLTYRRALTLPAGGRQFLRLPLYIPEFSHYTLTLVEQGTAPASGQPLPLRTLDAQARFCVAVDPLGRLAPGTINGCKSSLLLTDLGTLPETAMAWDSVDVLILHEVATSALTAAQQEALWAWVSLGGHLTVVEGPGTAQTLAGLPRALQQALTALPVGMTSSLGAGTLSRVRAENPTATDSTAWLGDWTGERVPAASVLGLRIPPAPAAEALMSVPQTSFPRPALLLGLLPAYALLVGPGMWWLARRLHRPRLVWLLTPLMIGVAALSMWLGLTTIVGGVFPITHEIAVIFGNDKGGPARVLQTTAIFAPRARVLTWNTQLAPRPFVGYFDAAASSYYFTANRPFPAEVLWAEGTSQIQATHPPGPLSWAAEGLMTLPALEAQLAFDTVAGRTVLQGTLRSEIALEKATLILGDGTHRLVLADNVPAGVRTQISVPLHWVQEFDPNLPICSNLSGGNFYFPSAALTPVTPPEKGSNVLCYLVATTPGVPYPTQNASQKRVEESCLILTLPCLAWGSGRMPLLPALSSENRGYGWLDPTGGVALASTMPVTLIYTPLYSGTGNDAFSAQRLILSLEKGGALPSFSLKIWSWTTEEWISQPPPTSRAPLILEGELARQVYDPQQGVRVRITPATETYFTLYLDVSVEIASQKIESSEP